MRQVLTVSEKISATKLKAKNALGKSYIFAGGQQYKVGDSILAVNGVIIQKVKQGSVRTYTV